MKGFIYIIRSHQTDDVYYGSTTQMLCKRMATHRANYKCWLNGTSNYVSSFDILKYEDAYIELVEEIEFQNKQELYAREGHHIRENNCVNKRIPDRTTQEYHKQYYKDNKDELSEYKKQHYEANKDDILEQQKQYRETHKADIAEKAKQHYEANKDKINERRRQRRAESKKVLPEKPVT
jgi:hypothetical protein